MKTTLQLGKWLTICDCCGFMFYNTDLRKDWRGLMVCEQDYESRHPQDLLRVRPDSPAVPWTRPEAPDVFLYTCGLNTRLSSVGFGTVGCATIGQNQTPINIT